VGLVPCKNGVLAFDWHELCGAGGVLPRPKVNLGRARGFIADVPQPPAFILMVRIVTDHQGFPGKALRKIPDRSLASTCSLSSRRRSATLRGCLRVCPHPFLVETLMAIDKKFGENDFMREMQTDTRRRPTLEPCASPSEAEIRAALDRITGSDVLGTSPQLAAFLRFVVESTLRGEAERIKGYTIATAALGRGQDFDPQADPIVRVEAGRLRRALERYYAGPGSADVIVIDVPRGRYVPTFCYYGADEVVAGSSLPKHTFSPARALHLWRGSLTMTSRVRRGLLSVATMVLICIAAMLAIKLSESPAQRTTATPAPVHAGVK
jgi:hypothetical protein